MLFKNDHFSKYFLSQTKNQNSMIISDINDGFVIKNNQFLTDKTIKIILFQDAFEICNPLGSFKKKHKIIGIYMTFANLPAWHRCQVDEIQLVALVYERDVKKNGFSNVLKVITDDIKILETQGFAVKDDAILKGSLVSVVGDNLGSHQIGGFNENFHLNGYFCRHCHINKPRNIKDFYASWGMRSKSSYNHDVVICLAAGDSSRGIKSDSLLNTTESYHVCNPGLPPCIAHDLFEGVVQFDLMLVINKIVSDNFTSYNDINRELKKLRFQFEKKNNFPVLSRSEKLPGNATQNMWLLNVLPFIFQDNPRVIQSTVWQTMLNLRIIVNLMLAFKLSNNQIDSLNSLIVEYLNDRSSTFPNESLRPKHHFMTHYPYLIKQFGPLRHLWTLRFENKHQYFKHAVNNNYINVLYSLSYRHQLLQALNSSKNTLFNDIVIPDSVEKCNRQNCSQHTLDMVKQFYNLEEEDLFISTSVTFRGILYKRGMSVCYSVNKFQEFEICKINFILIEKNYQNICFLGKKYKIVYDSEIGLYYAIDDLLEKIEEKNDDTFLKYSELACIETLLCMTKYNKTAFYFKYAPFNKEI